MELREKLTKPNVSAIAELNDTFRTSRLPLGGKGRKLATRGVMALPVDIRKQAYIGMATFNDFTEGNDPYGEHDFGTFDVEGHRFVWKIEYFSNDMQHGSPHPADAKLTTRTLTLMFPEDF